MSRVVPCATPIPGCVLIKGDVIEDGRGEFTKVFESTAFGPEGALVVEEQFWTVSNQDVLRGMHFQIPPKDHAKLVFAAQGEVIDVVLDLRRGSPAFGRAHSIVLSKANRQALLIPSGVAHGFLVTRGPAVLVYSTTSGYSPKHDKGVHWASIGFDWPCPKPAVSDRDHSFPPLDKFSTPFAFDGGGAA